MDRNFVTDNTNLFKSLFIIADKSCESRSAVMYTGSLSITIKH